MALVKWSMSARADSTLYVAREQITGTVLLPAGSARYGRQGAGAMQIAAW